MAATFAFEEFVLDTGDRRLRAPSGPVELNGRYFDALALRLGSTLTKEMFLSQLYGGMDEPEVKIIDVFICKLRKKLSLACGGANYIETVWGRGYVLRDPESDEASEPEPQAAVA